MALGSTLLVGAAALLGGVEGIACLVMASPLALFLAFVGGMLAYSIRGGFWRRPSSPALLLIVLLCTPLLMGAEAAMPRQAPVYEVRTAVEIDAPPETVWRNVVSFRQLPPPDDWLFRTGIAYPVRAEIRGQGVGAIRYCEFSTGAFVEPIEVWDEPRRLAFRVTREPAGPAGAVALRRHPPAARRGLPRLAARPVPADRAPRRPDAAGGDDLVPARALPGRVLAALVGRDPPPHPPARAGTRQAALGREESRYNNVGTGKTMFAGFKQCLGR